MNTKRVTAEVYDGIWMRPVLVKPNNELVTDGTETNAIPPYAKSVVVSAEVNDTNDWITLPALASVPNCHEITINCNSGDAFELRTPSGSAEEINSQDCDGTKEYLMTDGEVVKVIKINNTIGWMAHAYSAIGAVVTAVVPN